MNCVDNFLLTTDPETVASVRSAMCNRNGMVYVTTRIGMDVMDSGDSIECFSAASKGTLSHVKEYDSSEWDVVLAGIMLARTNVAVVELPDVHDARGKVATLMSGGLSLADAIAALLPE